MITEKMDCEASMIPIEVIQAVEKTLASGNEVLVKKERDKWVVIENKKRLVYKEK